MPYGMMGWGFGGLLDLAYQIVWIIVGIMLIQWLMKQNKK